MKVSALKYTVLTWVSSFTMVIFFLMPFHALLTVWLSSNFGHYTGIRLWKEGLLVLCICGILYLLVTDHKIRFHTLSRRLVWLILGYMLLNLVGYPPRTLCHLRSRNLWRCNYYCSCNWYSLHNS